MYYLQSVMTEIIDYRLMHLIKSDMLKKLKRFDNKVKTNLNTM